MAFAFALSDADLSASLQRIADEQLSSAISRLARVDRPDAVHSTRKSLKKTRALLRLLRAGLDDQPSANAALRNVGLALSARRDAQVRLATFDRLFPEPAVVLAPLRQQLATEGQPPPTDPAPGLIEALTAIRDRLSHGRLSGKSARILQTGLAVTRRKARRAMVAARANPASEVLIHDWRKRAKDHWYQSRLFAPVWPELFRPIVSDADRLGMALGDHHDLSVLALHAAGLPDAIVPDLARRMLEARVHDQQAGLEAEAFPLGFRLFAGDPDDVAGLWVDWHRVWRGKSA